MVPQNPATRARINRNGSHSSGSEISYDTGSLTLDAQAFLLGSNPTIRRVHNTPIPNPAYPPLLPSLSPAVGAGRLGQSNGKRRSVTDRVFLVIPVVVSWFSVGQALPSTQHQDEQPKYSHTNVGGALGHFAVSYFINGVREGVGYSVDDDLSKR